MTRPISRRSLLAGAGAATLAAAGIGELTLSRGIAGAATGGEPSNLRATVGTRRPNANPYLSGNFAPVHTEVSATRLRVTGKLPEALNGHFVRNGPNPVKLPEHKYSWFGGDGMLHIVELDGGAAVSYRNRWVRTPVVAEALGEHDPTGPASPTNVDISNTNTALLGGQLVSVTEGALPYAVGFDGSTIARLDTGGLMTHGLSAHSKHDPVTGEVHQIGYRVNATPYAIWQVFNAAGEVTSTQPIDLPKPVMIHNTTLTPKHVLVYDLPVVLSTPAIAAGWPVPFQWDPTYQARLGVITRATGAIQWIDLPPLWTFHDGSSHDTATGLSVDLVVFPEVFKGPDLAGPLATTSVNFERWEINTTTGTVKRTVLDDRGQEFPRCAPGTFGTQARYTYSVSGAGNGFGVLGLGNSVLRHDLVAGTSTTWSVGTHRSTGEAVFVADPSRTHREDGGWLLCFVYDAITDRSSLEVLDAEDVAAGPFASVELPQRVPEGFHGNWYATV